MDASDGGMTTSVVKVHSGTESDSIGAVTIIAVLSSGMRNCFHWLTIVGGLLHSFRIILYKQIGEIVDTPTAQRYNTAMQTPFPGMDPYLEHPSIWPDVLDRLIAALADSITPLIAPQYYVAIERRGHQPKSADRYSDDRSDGIDPRITHRMINSAPNYVPAVDPFYSEVGEGRSATVDAADRSYLAIHDVASKSTVTIVEALSLAEKTEPDTRRRYERVRQRIVESTVNLVEIDLLREGAPLVRTAPERSSDYRILISRTWTRPRAQLYTFSLRQPIPQFPLPLAEDESEPVIDFNGIVHSLYGRARYDLRIDYDVPPLPPLDPSDVDWAQSLAHQT